MSRDAVRPVAPLRAGGTAVPCLVHLFNTTHHRNRITSSLLTSIITNLCSATAASRSTTPNPPMDRNYSACASWGRALAGAAPCRPRPRAARIACSIARPCASSLSTLCCVSGRWLPTQRAAKFFAYMLIESFLLQFQFAPLLPLPLSVLHQLSFALIYKRSEFLGYIVRPKLASSAAASS